MSLFSAAGRLTTPQEIDDVIPRLKPSMGDSGRTNFGGWARMAHPIASFCIVEVGKPNLGEMKPSSVRADVTLHLNVRCATKIYHHTQDSDLFPILICGF